MSVEEQNQEELLSRVEVKSTPLSKIEGRPILVLNPAHGNEPYILATALGREVSKKFAREGLEQPILVLPLLYGERQLKILLEENPSDADLIHHDEEYGRILQRIMFGSSNFSDHLKQVNQHYDEVENLITARYGIDTSTFPARNLASRENVDLSAKNIIGTIDVGSRVSVRIPHRYFAYPALLTEILKRTSEHPELGFSESDMKKLADRMTRTEAAYSQVFIPWVNTFSYEHAEDLNQQPEVIEGRHRIYTPPMKKDIERTEGNLDKEGVYIMFSGTGSGLESTHALVQAAKEAGIEAYSPPWAEIEGTKKILPEAMSDKKMLAILGRSGWGTGWQALNIPLPWLVAEYQQGDDPETYFNNKTIEALKLGKVIGSSITPSELSRLVESISPGLESLKAATKERFGTNDGIDYISEKIFKDLVTAK